MYNTIIENYKGKTLIGNILHVCRERRNNCICPKSNYKKYYRVEVRHNAKTGLTSANTFTKYAPDMPEDYSKKLPDGTQIGNFFYDEPAKAENFRINVLS
jgi:hypothetical protein